MQEDGDGGVCALLSKNAQIYIELSHSTKKVLDCGLALLCLFHDGFKVYEQRLDENVETIESRKACHGSRRTSVH
jgi:hypothetical protein